MTDIMLARKLALDAYEAVLEQHGYRLLTHQHVGSAERRALRVARIEYRDEGFFGDSEGRIPVDVIVRKEHVARAMLILDTRYKDKIAEAEG